MVFVLLPSLLLDETVTTDPRFSEGLCPFTTLCESPGLQMAPETVRNGVGELGYSEI